MSDSTAQLVSRLGTALRPYMAEMPYDAQVILDKLLKTHVKQEPEKWWTEPTLF